MPVSRRALLRSGWAAALWSLSPNAQADDGPTLTATSSSLRLAASPAPATSALGYDNACPGRLLRIRLGESLALRFRNDLQEATSLAFPGLRGPRAELAFGGLGQPLIDAGATRDIKITPQEPGFQIYGALLGADPRQQMARGLYGPLIVDDPTPPDTDLEAIVLVSDWRLDASAAITDLGDATLGRGAGRIGGLISANGLPAPFQFSGPPGGRVRLRLGNCATARVLYLSIDGVRPRVVAVDGQPSAPFEPLHNLLPVGPGARFELMFDLPRDPGAIVRFYMRPEDTRSQERDEELLAFATSGEAAKDKPPIKGLPDNPRLPAEIELERAHRTDLTLDGGGAAALKINGQSSPTKPAFVIPRGSPATLAFINKTAFTQTMRLTGHVARLLHSLDDGWDPYWRDIFIIPPGKTVHLAFVADNPGLWPLESTSPERRNAGLMTTFQVL